MKMLLKVVLTRIALFLRAFLDNYILTYKKEKAEKAEEISDEKVKKADKAYDDFKSMLDDYRKDGK